ncbi:MAG: zinc ribbon domain-containing protein [Eubacteriales bacterium]|nr:zinc ribbon domain-containing protein [Eubacteriales bacterium]
MFLYTACSPLYTVASPEEWNDAQARIGQRAAAKASAGNKTKHRYAGLLECEDCRNPLMAIKRYWNGVCRVEYVCKGYHRYGKQACSSHRVHEDAVDRAVWAHLVQRRASAARMLSKMKELQKIRALRKPILDARICYLTEKRETLQLEIDRIALAKIMD